MTTSLSSIHPFRIPRREADQAFYDLAATTPQTRSAATAVRSLIHIQTHGVLELDSPMRTTTKRFYAVGMELCIRAEAHSADARTRDRDQALPDSTRALLWLHQIPLIQPFTGRTEYQHL